MAEFARTPDWRERERALDPAHSFIVQAPAGSGKTELLIQRYLGLLATVDEPEEIIAITFTRKAAAEMRERVLEALARADAADAAETEHARRTRELARAARARDVARGWRSLDSPSRLRIQTIDSLCAALTRQMPILSRFGSQPEIVEDASALYAEAARATVALIEAKDPAAELVARLLEHLDNNVERVEDMLVEMLHGRDHWLRHVMAPRADLERALASERRALLARAGSLLPAAARTELLAVANYALDKRGAAGLAAFPGGDDVAAWTLLAELLLTKDGDWRKRLTVAEGFPAGEGKAGKALARAWKERHAALVEALGREALRTTLADLRLLPPAAYADSQWQVLEAITELLKRAVAELKLVFQSRGQVDFTEVAQRALLALEDAAGPTELALRLDYQIRHLLIDEFQDTSISQFELLERLTAGWMPGDGRSLFAVGDPMQSIYRFREAEVGLFLKARAEGLGNVALEPLALTANFRSQAGIVDWVNQAFAAIMPGTEDVAAGAVAYSPSQAVHARAAEEAVSVYPRFGGDAASEAAQVVDILAGIFAGTPRPSVAILVRGRSSLRNIVPALQAAGIAYRAVEIDRLEARPVVQDLLALTRALAHEGDRIAWLAVLRAPWCGLALADLLAAAGGEQTVWRAINDEAVIARMSEDGRAHLERLRSVLANALANRLCSSLRDAVEGCWLALGGPACVSSSAELEDAASYLDHLEAQEQAGTIADFEAFAAGLNALYAAPDAAAGEDAVQIMTIHKAKGLEFDQVIVPGLDRTPPAEAKKLFLWMERAAPSEREAVRADLLLAPIEETGAERDPIYNWIRKLAARKGEYEDGRLLYVAATRARARLHLLGAARVEVKEGEPAVRRPDARSLLGKLWPAVAEAFQRAAAQSAVPAAAPAAAAAVPDQRLRRLAPAWSLPAAPASVDWKGDHAEREPQDEIEYSWVGETARRVGSVVHRWLQRIAEDGMTDWTAARVRGLEPAFANELAARGVGQGEIAAASARVGAALAAALADARGRWLLGPQAEAKSEYRITALIDGERRSLVVDRCFTDAQGRQWIVDYKTSAHQGADSEAFLDAEQARYRAQLERYARALAPRAPIMLGLYFPLLGGWREWSA